MKKAFLPLVEMAPERTVYINFSQKVSDSVTSRSVNEKRSLRISLLREDKIRSAEASFLQRQEASWRRYIPLVNLNSKTRISIKII